MLPELSVTWTVPGIFVKVKVMSPDELAPTMSVPARPLTTTLPESSWNRRSPARPDTVISPELLSSRMPPVRPDAVIVPEPSSSRMFPARPDAPRSPELSESVTVPRIPLAFRFADESVTATGRLAGAVMAYRSEQTPAGTRHWECRTRPAEVDRQLNVGRTRLPRSVPRTRIRSPVPLPRVTSALPTVTLTWPPLTGTLRATRLVTWRVKMVTAPLAQPAAPSTRMARRAGVMGRGTLTVIPLLGSAGPRGPAGDHGQRAAGRAWRKCC